MVIQEVDPDLSDRVNAAGLKTFSTKDFTCVEVRFPSGAVLRREVAAGHRVNLHGLWREALEIQERSV